MSLALSPASAKPAPFQTWVDDPLFDHRLTRLVLEHLPTPQEEDARWLVARAACGQQSPAEFALKHFKSLEVRAPVPGVSYLGGRHVVFERGNYPGWVFKIFYTASVHAAKESLEFAVKALQEHPLKTCFIPDAHYFDLENEWTLVQMSKAVGILGEEACREASEREFELFDERPDLKEKWRQFFNNAAEFICRNAYVDSGWHNMVLDLEQGITFIDFEGVYASRESVAEGLKRLLLMAPPIFFDEIIGWAEKFKSKGELLFKILSNVEPGLFGDQTEGFKTLRARELALRSQVRSWHKEKGIAAEALIAIRDDFTEKEKSIVTHFNQKLAANLRIYKGSPVDQRCLYGQLLLSIPGFSSIEDVEETLEALKDKGILCAWEKKPDEYDPRLTSFYLYF